MDLCIHLKGDESDKRKFLLFSWYVAEKLKGGGGSKSWCEEPVCNSEKNKYLNKDDTVNDSMTHFPFFLLILISKKLSFLSFLCFFMVFPFSFLSIQNI